MNCSVCQAPYTSGTKYCGTCGNDVGKKDTSGIEAKEPSKKSYVTAVCLAGILGTLGIHHFYVGRWLHGLFDLSLLITAIIFFSLSLWVPAILFLLADLIHNTYFVYKLIIGEYRDGSGRLVKIPGSY
jgi:TM2 domain-containing membrane protein YozV